MATRILLSLCCSFPAKHQPWLNSAVPRCAQAGRCRCGEKSKQLFLGCLFKFMHTDLQGTGSTAWQPLSPPSVCSSCCCSGSLPAFSLPSSVFNTFSPSLLSADDVAYFPERTEARRDALPTISAAAPTARHPPWPPVSISLTHPWVKGEVLPISCTASHPQ